MTGRRRRTNAVNWIADGPATEGSVQRYSHTQKIPDKLMTLGSLAGVALALTPPGLVARVALLGVLGAAGAMIRSLTVEVDAEAVRLRFGNGLVKKSFPLKEISSASPVRTTLLQGWGIHWIGSGWLYNIYGLDAVLITLRNGGCVTIGTDEPAALAAAINERLGSGVLDAGGRSS